MKKNLSPKYVILGISFFLIVFLLFLFLTPKNIYNKGGYNKLEKIHLGGIKQWIDIKTTDTSKPILLVLHGGPGYVIAPIFYKYNLDLLDTYTLVNWDQRGSGKSYNKYIKKHTMTLTQLIADAHELTSYLKKRFKQDKIYLLSHSFGSTIGINLIDKYPEDYHGFISIGQVVSFVENEQLSYDFALEQAYYYKNFKAVNELLNIGRPDEFGYYFDDNGYEITNKWLELFGGDLYKKNSLDEIENIILDYKYYKNNNKFYKGLDFSQAIFNDESIKNIDYRKTQTKFDVPVFFISGKHDYDTPSKLVEDYYKLIDSPNKKLYWFENSAHFPFYEEADKFNKILNSLVKS